MFKSAYYSIIAGFSLSVLILLTFLFYTYYYEFIALIQSDNQLYAGNITQLTPSSTTSNIKSNQTQSKKTSSVVTSSMSLMRALSSSASHKQNTYKQYDKLSILIDHDLFKNLNADLFQKLKLTNDSVVYARD